MTGAVMAAATGGGIVPLIGGLTVNSLDAASPWSSSASFTLQADGTLTKSVSPADGGTTLGSSWIPGAPITGIGNSYWVRATLTADTAPTSGTLNTWLALSTACSWGNTQSGSLGTRTSTLKLEFATDSGGANIVYTKTGLQLVAEAA